MEETDSHLTVILHTKGKYVWYTDPVPDRYPLESLNFSAIFTDTLVAVVERLLEDMSGIW